MVPLIIRVSFKLVYLFLDFFDMGSVSYHELFVLLLESSLETEVHELYHLVDALDVVFNFLLS
jgi:hypothetical protein